MKDAQVHELLYQAMETELGGVQVYETAIRCAVNDDLKEEWSKYLDETENHVRIVTKMFEELDLDPETETPGRQVVRMKGQALIQSMEMALQAGDPAAAQLVAAEAVVDAETKDHANWELIGRVAEKATGAWRRCCRRRTTRSRSRRTSTSTTPWVGRVSCGSSRSGMPAVLPPPEEQKKVVTAIGASRAEQARDEMVGKTPKS